MVSATTDIVSNVSFQNSRTKSSRDDQLSISDSFGSLVDSNTAVTASSDRLPTPQPDLPAPARRDDDRASSSDQTRRDDDRQDAANSADTRANDTQATAPAKDSRSTDKPAKDDTKANSKDDTKADGKSGTKEASSKDGDKPTKAEAITATTEQPVAVTAVAVAIPVPVATTDATVKAAATPETGGATQPLAIAAAVLKAQTAATEAAAAGTDKVPTTTAAEGDETFAALIATATPTDGKTGAKKAVITDATAKTDTKTKTDGKTDVATTTAAQPTDATTAPQKTSGDTTTDNVSADGAKPDATAVTADAAKPAPSKAHEQAPDQTAKAATPDLGAQINNNIPQTQLQPTSTAAAPTPQLTAKVADGTAVPLNGVAVEIAQSAKAGKSSFDIRLDPAELGRIDVRLEVDKHGNVTSHLTVEKPETLTMLRQDAPQLQRALEQAGLKTNDGGMQFSLRDQSSGQQQQNGDNSGRNAHRLIISEDESLPAVPAGRGYGRMLGSSTGVDISI